MKLKGLKKCKTGLGVCNVSEAAKTCINCRYKKCLSIGMTPDLLQGKRKREEEGAEPEEEKELSEPIEEEYEEPEPENLVSNNKVITEQQEQDQPLKLVKKTDAQQSVESGKFRIKKSKMITLALMSRAVHLHSTTDETFPLPLQGLTSLSSGLVNSAGWTLAFLGVEFSLLVTVIPSWLGRPK